MLWVPPPANVLGRFMMIGRKRFWIFMLRLGGIPLPNYPTFPLFLGIDDRLADERKGTTTSPSTSTGPEFGAQTTTEYAPTSEKTT